MKPPSVNGAANWQRWLGTGRNGDPLRLAADAANLPLASRSAAMVWSNLLLHWLDDPLPALRVGLAGAIRRQGRDNFDLMRGQKLGQIRLGGN